MILRNSEITEFLQDFERYAHQDGIKYFLTLNTVNPKGTLTIMKYPEGNFTYHRKNENYWDIKEVDIDLEMLSDIIWGFRKTINDMILAGTMAH
ncbi:hypothetical protein COJ96_24815 [Bacillus sp. AFS073361]|uniref:hypothetical protein n=1 Tax=Bacillus sp. AFS073361 TaxID=2033511 RepID=UPI000BF70104|nr:hypothetical protein [Bacillus sp. AFS073361]PFP22926.1 hypothetical protein COJ96_24815 [Bacillus sp. AFS073361]